MLYSLLTLNDGVYMAERLSSKEKSLKIAAVLALSGTALAGCAREYNMSTESIQEEFEERTQEPSERFYEDYLKYSVFYNFDAKIEPCLDGSAYDITAGEQGRASYTPPSLNFDEGTDTLTVLPPSGTSPLSLTGFDQVDHTLVGANPESQSILDAYGCEVSTYSWAQSEK
jgi:hypothetical protein